MKSKRNGKIELLRFFFCMSVLLFHIGKDAFGSNVFINDYLTVFARGRSGVEFFFLVSGFLAAKSASKIRLNGDTIGRNSFNFILKKINSILPYHIFAVMVTVVLFFIYGNNFVMDIVKRLPSAFFLQRTGMCDRDFITVEWYICSMLLALAIIFPLLLKNFDLTTLVIAPVASSLLIGYLKKTYGAMPVSDEFATFTYSCNIRAIAVILLGCFCFAISEKIREAELSRLKEILLIIIENGCWLVSMYFMFSGFHTSYDSYVIYFMALGITLTFSRDFDCKIYNNKFVYFLGAFSLPLYLCQNIARSIVGYELDSLTGYTRIAVTVSLAVIISLIAYILWNAIKKLRLKRAVSK